MVFHTHRLQSKLASFIWSILLVSIVTTFHSSIYMVTTLWDRNNYNHVCSCIYTIFSHWEQPWVSGILYVHTCSCSCSYYTYVTTTNVYTHTHILTEYQFDMIFVKLLAYQVLPYFWWFEWVKNTFDCLNLHTNKLKDQILINLVVITSNISSSHRQLSPLLLDIVKSKRLQNSFAYTDSRLNYI